ncbi:MAG: peptide-N-glycosidase F-related protein [Nannocystaceae bacterium]
MPPRRRLAVLALPLGLLVAACAGSDPPTQSASESDAATGATGTTGDDSATGTDATTDASASTGDASAGETTTTTGGAPEPEVITVMQDVVFYDGYAGLVDEPVPEGMIRHSNALYAAPFADAQLAAIQETLTIGVIIGALCDNYDRIGSVHLALVPKGQATYVPAEVERVELARFITPFMNMNKSPTTVPFQWSANNVVPILRDPELQAAYDFWFELSVFGVPYAAQNEVNGCDGRIDTQLGTLLLHTDSAAEPPEFSELVPVAIGEAFNNYQEGASDAIGATRKTVTFALPADTEAAQLVLITSNHGANQGGEEYIRREHLVYVDGALVHEYTPGRESCEPFRKYNTQGNGIYGPSPRSPEEWQSFSNWCPGDIIDTRIIPLGATAGGSHEFVLDVPDAEFVDGQGNFPFSLYVQAQ